MNIKFKGKVIKGVEVGAKFGIATANIEITEEKPDLEEGVYFVEVTHRMTFETFLQEKKYHGILHFGKLETFSRGFTCEVHLLDFNQSIYGESLEIEVLKFLRPTQKFQNADLLFTQIEGDIAQAEKYFLRKKIYRKWEKLSAEENQKLNEKAVAKIEKLPDFLSAKNVFIYAPQKNKEIDFTEPLMKKFPEKSYSFPKVLPENGMKFFRVKNYADLEVGAYDILEPSKDSSEGDTPDIIFVPAVAADGNGHRLGKGLGYYDRYLENLEVPTVCVLPAFAIVEKVPVQEHDRSVGGVVEV